MNLPDIVEKKLISLGAGLEDSFLVAVSGGADSTALLLAMNTVIGKKEKLNAAHLDHGVRLDSGGDLEAVVKLCKDLGVGLLTDSLKPDELEAHRRIYGSLEAGMRVLRYRFLHGAAQKTASQWIVTGHTADDQSETVLFRAVRGMDWRSFGSIPGRREIILRPLIDVSRSAVWNYCRSMGVCPVMDPSNYDEAYARSKIRHRTLPGLAIHFNDRICDLLLSMGRACEVLSQVEENLLNENLPVRRVGKGGPVTKDLIIALPVILRKRFIVNYLYWILDEYPSRALAEDVLEFVLEGKNGQLTLPGGALLTLSYGLVSVSREPDPGAGLSHESLELKIPGRLPIPSAKMIISAKISALQEPGRYPAGKTALISAKGVTGSLWVRRRLGGDLFRPLGMERDKKLKKFLVDRKVPRADRDRLPLFLDGQGDILWVGGIEISQKAALEGIKGEKAIQLQIEELNDA